MGRFFQVDPLAHWDHSVSPFAYARNNPAVLNDPSGLMVPAGWSDAQMRAVWRAHSTSYSSFEDWAIDGGPNGGGNAGGGGGSSPGAGSSGYWLSGESYAWVSNPTTVDPYAGYLKNTGTTSYFVPTVGGGGVWSPESGGSGVGGGSTSMSSGPVTGGAQQEGACCGGGVTAAAAGVLAFISTDAAIPEPTDILWPKWVVYAAAGAVAGVIVYNSTATKSKSAQEGAQYTLRARTSGFYPTMNWGSPIPGGTVYLNAGDIWKIGETMQYDAASQQQWRYSQTQLNAWNVNFIPEFTGSQTAIKAMEGLKLIGYFTLNGALPPGNKGFK